MKKRVYFAIGVFFIILFLIGSFFYMSLAKPKLKNLNFTIENTAELLQIEEIKSIFDEKFVYFLLLNIKAYELHNPPLSSDLPKLEMKIDDKIYSAVIDSGNILVSERAVSNPDIIIYTSLDEASKMVKYPEYIPKSFQEKKSKIELVAEKTKLFSKGYLNLYNELTGNSITGNVVKIYTN